MLRKEEAIIKEVLNVLSPLVNKRNIITGKVKKLTNYLGSPSTLGDGAWQMGPRDHFRVKWSPAWALALPNARHGISFLPRRER